MLRSIYYILLFLLVILGISFACLNAEPVTINYYFSSGTHPLSMILALGFSMGAVIGFTASLGMLFRSKRSAYRYHQRAKVAEKEVANLRAIPIKEVH